MHRAILLCGLVSLLQSTVHAGDWPQILGPNRNGIATGERLAESWPADGPRLNWEREAGRGFAGLAVQGDTAILFHRVKDQEVVEALDVTSGEPRWTKKFDVDFSPRFIADDGPRCVPVIQDGKVFLYGAKGGLHCLDLKSGSVAWNRDTYEDYNPKRSFRGEPPEGYFGIGSAPIVVDNKVIVNVGGADSDAGIVAFSTKTGKTEWTSTSARASYSSPVLATVAGKRHLIFAARFQIVSVDPDTGKVRFSIPFGRPGPNVTAANPIVLNGHLFVTASYGFGAVWAKIGPAAADVVWESNSILSSQYTTCISHGGHLYGIHGRQDSGSPSLRCFDPATKKVQWTESGFGYATLIAAGKHLLAMKTDGVLTLAQLNTDGYKELAEAQVFQSTTRALPALSRGRLFVRDTRTVKCLHVGAK